MTAEVRLSIFGIGVLSDDNVFRFAFHGCMSQHDSLDGGPFHSLLHLMIITCCVISDFKCNLC